MPVLLSEARAFRDGWLDGMHRPCLCDQTLPLKTLTLERALDRLANDDDLASSGIAKLRERDDHGGWRRSGSDPVDPTQRIGVGQMCRKCPLKFVAQLVAILAARATLDACAVQSVAIEIKGTLAVGANWCIDGFHSKHSDLMEDRHPNGKRSHWVERF